MNAEEFVKKYCLGCGSQRCEGIGTEWFDGCSHREELDDRVGNLNAEEVARGGIYEIDKETITTADTAGSAST